MGWRHLCRIWRGRIKIIEFSCTHQSCSAFFKSRWGQTFNFLSFCFCFLLHSLMRREPLKHMISWWQSWATKCASNETQKKETMNIVQNIKNGTATNICCMSAAISWTDHVCWQSNTTQPNPAGHPHHRAWVVGLLGWVADWLANQKTSEASSQPSNQSVN